MAAFQKKSSLIRVEQSSNVLLEQATQFETLDVESSRTRYERYSRNRRNSYALARYAINSTNYLRKPNGEGNDEGMWGFPDWGIDHWDYYVNRDMSQLDRVEIYTELDHRYIPLPDRNQPDTGGYARLDGTYPKKYRRLWDLLYNQEHYMDPSLKRPRTKPFPTTPGVYKIVPDVLPDTTMPEYLSDRYPWAAWETSVYPNSSQEAVLDETTRQRSQRYTYVRAHGRIERTKGENDLDAFNFEPHDVTNEVPLLFRAFKAAHQRQSALLYNPVVLRDVSAYNNNGWLSFYRQEVRTTKNLVFTSSDKIWKYFVQVRNEVQRGQLTAVESVAKVMQEEYNESYPRTTSDPPDLKTLSRFYLPVYVNFLNNREVAATQRQKDAVDRLNEVLDLLRRNRDGGDILELSYNSQGSPVFYDQPYKLVTIQVVEREARTITKDGVTFDDDHVWVLSVPPFLDTKIVGEVETSAEAKISWYTDTSKDLLIDQVPGVVHQATVQFIAHGEKRVFANVLNVRYQFNLEATRVEVRHVYYDLEKKDRFYALGGGRWSGLRFNNRKLARVSRSSPELKYVLAEHWNQVKSQSPEFFRRSVFVVKKTRAQYFDRCLQFLWVENEYEEHVFYLFVFEPRTLDVYVSRFGDDVSLQVGAFKGKNVRWRNPSKFVGVRSFGTSMVVTVVLPRDLGVYTAEILDDKAHFFVHFNLQMRWLSSVPQSMIQRGGTQDFDWKNSEWPEILGERVDDFNSVSLFPNLGDLGRLRHLESLRIEEESPFYKAMIRCFAKWYNTDLQNYARLFSHAVDYARIGQQLIDASGDRLLVADDAMPDDMALLLPPHLNPPLLLLSLDSGDVEMSGAALAYVVYDPVNARWRNILAFNEEHAFDIPWSWRYEIDELTQTLLYDSYTHCSPAYVNGAFAVERSRLEKEVLNAKEALLAERYRRDRTTVGDSVETLKLEAVAIPRYRREFNARIGKELVELKCRVDINVNWDTQFGDDLREMVNFLQYFSYRCDDLQEELPSDDDRQEIISYMKEANNGIFNEKFNILYPLIVDYTYTKENVEQLLGRLQERWQPLPSL